MSAGGLFAAFSAPAAILGKFGRLSGRCGEQCATALGTGACRWRGQLSHSMTMTVTVDRTLEPAAANRLRRALHHGHLTDPDKEPTEAIVQGVTVCPVGLGRYRLVCFHPSRYVTFSPSTYVTALTGGGRPTSRSDSRSDAANPPPAEPPTTASFDGVTTPSSTALNDARVSSTAGWRRVFRRSSYSGT
jgi:hypothetical protein